VDVGMDAMNVTAIGQGGVILDNFLKTFQPGTDNI